jgi:hypothetical protein
VSTPSNAGTPLILLSFKQYVEALFLGTGPLAQAGQAGCLAGPGRMAGWPSGAAVTVILGRSLSTEQKRRASAAAMQSSDATAGLVNATIRESEDLYPTPDELEIAVRRTSQDTPFPCSPAADGCTVPGQSSNQAVLSRVVILMRGESTLLGHEIGHALYGFCHLSTEAGYVSVMGNFDQAGRGLSEADLAATQAVYRAGLRAGAVRSDFLSAGLIDR